MTEAALERLFHAFGRTMSKIRLKLNNDVSDDQAFLHVNGELDDFKGRKRKKAEKAAKDRAKKIKKKEMIDTTEERVAGGIMSGSARCD